MVFFIIIFPIFQLKKAALHYIAAKIERKNTINNNDYQHQQIFHLHRFTINLSSFSPIKIWLYATHSEPKGDLNREENAVIGA